MRTELVVPILMHVHVVQPQEEGPTRLLDPSHGLAGEEHARWSQDPGLLLVPDQFVAASPSVHEFEAGQMQGPTGDQASGSCRFGQCQPGHAPRNVFVHAVVVEPPAKAEGGVDLDVGDECLGRVASGP